GYSRRPGQSLTTLRKSIRKLGLPAALTYAPEQRRIAGPLSLPRTFTQPSGRFFCPIAIRLTKAMRQEPPWSKLGTAWSLSNSPFSTAIWKDVNTCLTVGDHL